MSSHDPLTHVLTTVATILRHSHPEQLQTEHMHLKRNIRKYKNSEKAELTWSYMNEPCKERITQLQTKNPPKLWVVTFFRSTLTYANVSPSPWIRVLFEELIFPQLFKHLPLF